MIWYVAFLLVVASVFYLVNWVVAFSWDTLVKIPIVGRLPIFQAMIDTFLVLVFIFAFLQMLGIGRGPGFPIPK